jgi:hypothetical protein
MRFRKYPSASLYTWAAATLTCAAAKDFVWRELRLDWSKQDYKQYHHVGSFIGIDAMVVMASPLALLL